MSEEEIREINGGGILRKYGEYIGEKVGGILIIIGVAILTRNI